MLLLTIVYLVVVHCVALDYLNIYSLRPKAAIFRVVLSQILKF